MHMIQIRKDQVNLISTFVDRDLLCLTKKGGATPTRASHLPVASCHRNMTRLPLRSSAIRRDPALPQRIPRRRREGSRDDVRTRRRRREGKRMCCCLRGPKWRRGVAAAGTVSRVSSASGAGASHGAAVAAAVGVGVVWVAAGTFRMGTDICGSKAGWG